MHTTNRSHAPKLLSCLVVFFLSVLAACGGGSSAASSSEPAVAISISPTSATLGATDNQTFTAAVTNSANSGVTWSVQEGAAGGAITSTGVYAAPFAAGTFHVIATSQADPSKHATSTLTVKASPTLDRDDTIAGTDANMNGVRDDVERIVNAYPLTADQKTAALQFAASLQVALVASVDKGSAYNNALEMDRGQECMASKITGYEAYANEIHAYTVNTENRFNAYVQFEQYIRGSVFPEVTGTICK